MMRLRGRIAIVTGASRGIGRGIALALAREGATAVLAARDAEGLSETARQIEAAGGISLTVPTDITSESQVERLFATVEERFGRLELLVNNAGAFDGGPLDTTTLDEWENVMAVNLRGPFLCTRAAFRLMKPQRTGRIINIGSISGQRVRHGTAAYATSKHGIWGLTQATALEGREHGITCGCLHPGNTLVERRQTARMEDTEPMIDVAHLAEVALLMASLPPEVEMLEAIVLPRDQLYVGRG